MTDRLSEERRSWNMSRIRSKNTKPEIFLRSLLHRAGFRFRINKANLTGKPDIVLAKYKTVIFVHGCFWHGHENCKFFRLPKTNVEFWSKKIETNIGRDKHNLDRLKKDGWNAIVIWACEIKNPDVINKLFAEIYENEIVEIK